jgi:diacylglycerol O-acyltransferase
MEHLSPLDSMFLHVEDGISHMHVGSCAVFEGPPPAYGDVLDLIDSKLPLIPRYRQKVRFVPGGLGRPVWIDDPHFNLRYHVRHSALPAPGSDAELDALMGRVMSQELDRHRPLWEAWMVEGLSGGRWALVSKVHHCMVDGVSGTELLTILLDPQRDAPTSARHDTWTPAAEPSDAALILHSLGQVAGSSAERRRVLRSLTRTPRHLVSHVSDAFAAVIAAGSELVPRPSPSIVGSIGPHRRWSSAHVDLADIKAVKHAFGGTVNDVVLTVIAGAFRDLLLSRSEDPDHITVRTLVPVSVRAADDLTPSNQVAAMVARLPIEVADPVTRLAAVRAEMERLKASHQVETSKTLTSLAELTPPSLLAIGLHATAALARELPQHAINTVTTNVPGPQFPLYAVGCRMVTYLPFVPLAQGVRIGVAIVSYDGGVSFGVTGDYDTIPDLAPFCRRIETELAELRRVARPAPRRAS